MGDVLLTLAQAVLLLFGVLIGVLLIISPVKALALHNRYWQPPQRWWPDWLRNAYDPLLLTRSAYRRLQWRVFGVVLVIVTSSGLIAVFSNR